MLVTITSVVSLTKNQLELITGSVKKKYPKREFTFEQIIDPKVLGGVRIALGSQSFDATIKSKLSTLKTQLYQQM